MNATHLPAGFVVRAALDSDQSRLAAFRCAGNWEYEREVEEFVQRRCLSHAASNPSYRLLLVFEHDRLVGCTAHHPDLQVTLASETQAQAATITRLQLLALHLEQQGRRLDDGRKLVDLMFQTLIVDALQRGNPSVLNAIVARDNVRSVAVCERNGLTSQTRYDARHVRLTGHFSIRS